MTIKTKKLLDEMTDALFEKKAVLLTGNTGVGKTYLAKKISEKLVERKYSCFPSSKDQTVNVEIISCHNSVTYEEIVGGITADTDSGKMFFEYKDKIFLETIIRAAVDYNEGKGTKYVLIMDDLQRNDVSTLIGDAVNAIGLEGEEEKLCLNSGMIVEIPPNFYIIGTYNAAETGAILLPSDLISKFYVREILSEIEYITEDLETENAVYYDQVRSLVLNYLDMQYRRSTYDQSRYFLGHGYFSGNNVSLKIRYQLIPILKQYISEGILDSAAEESVHLLETACIKKKVVVGKNVQKSIYSEYRCGVTAAQFIHEDSTRKCSSIPIENLVGRIIDQQLLSDEKIKHAILFNKKVCYREMEVGGVTYQASALGKRLSTSQMVGILSITSERNPELKDTTDREKLVDTKQYKQFCKITESIILTLENLRNMDKKTNNTVKNPTLTDLLSPLEPSALESKVELMIQGGGSSEEILDVIHEYSANTEKNLSELNDRLIYYAQTASLGSVSAVIMHEIRSGMTVIKRFLNRMREMFVITDPRTKEYFEDAETSHQRLLEVANSFASLYRKNIYKEKHKTKILEAVESSVRLIKAKKEAKKIDFIIDIDENDVCTMHIGEFQTILINLLDNACYWLRNAKNKKIKISAKLSSNNKNMEIVVSDNGPGIIEEEKQKIFQPGVTAKPQGIGMGLVIVTELLNNHNCKIRLETPGEYGGATFAFEVPME